MNIKTFLLAASLIIPMAASAQTAQDEESYYREAVRTLASDKFAGRKPMSSQEHYTLDYIIQEYKKQGLKPGNNGQWLQPVDMISTRTKPTKGNIVVKGRKGKATLANFDDFIVWTYRATDKIQLKNAEYVFCGHGITAPEFDWDDYKDIDVKGKIVITVAGDPGFFDDNMFHGKNATYYSRQWVKWENAQAHGAAGCIVIHETEVASYKWGTIQGSQSGIQQNLVDDSKNMDLMGFQGWMSSPAAKRLFSACGYDMEKCREQSHKRGFKSFSLGAKGDISLDVSYSIGKSYNVVGLIEGTDLKDECVIYSSHWDHLGIGKPDEKGDSIYNGAGDNATGVAAMFVIAGKYKRCPTRPRRSILFVAVTGEESGFLGSQWYCEHPIFPLSKSAANINIDGPAPFERTNDVLLRAPGISTAEKWLYVAAQAQGRVVKPYPVDPAAIYYRCDHISFAKHGIPALFFDKGNDYVDKKRHESIVNVDSYHRPNDEYNDSWIVDGCMENLNLYYAVGMMIANDSEMPQWSSSSEFQRH